MIQDKDFMIRRLKEIAELLNAMVGGSPDNVSGENDIQLNQQIYTATGFEQTYYLELQEAELENILVQKGDLHVGVFAEFLANLFFHHYKQTNDLRFLKKAQSMYLRYEHATGNFSLPYFQRRQLPV